MKQLTGKELCRIIEGHGWKLLRIHGSHHICGKEGSIVRLSIPVHGNQPLKSGLLRFLLKSAEIPDEEIYVLRLATLWRRRRSKVSSNKQA